MKTALLGILAVIVLVGCNQPGAPSATSQSSGKPETVAKKPQSLAEARQGFRTKLTRQESAKTPVPDPPPELFKTVHFDSPVGKLAAYLSPDAKDGKKHPAIIWITGGDCSTIGEGCWEEGPPDNEQSAAAYRKAGILMMFPSLRGGNDNPGFKEGFLGEVEDVLAAADFLAKQNNVDPDRIYLGGHSTGGTLVLLVAETSDRFRAIFSFGPVAKVFDGSPISSYPPEYLPFDTSNEKELSLRTPVNWTHSIKTPTFVLEGMAPPSNWSDLVTLNHSTQEQNPACLEVPGATHFSVLSPVNQLIAKKILSDTGPNCNLTITEQELKALNVPKPAAGTP